MGVSSPRSLPTRGRSGIRALYLVSVQHQGLGLTMNRDKCAFSMSKLTFTGYLLSNQGIGPTESRVEAVMGAREPQNAREVQDGGTMPARFIPNFASIAEPRHRLKRKDTPFVWGKNSKVHLTI